MPPRQRKTAATKLADLVIEQVPIEQLKPDPENARTHDERNIAAIKASLRRFGQRKPMVVSKDYTAVAGSGTLEAMLALDYTHVWVSVFPGSPAEARAYGIADNRTGELAGWNPEVLMSHLASFDGHLLEAAGYDQDDLVDLVERFGAAPDLDDLSDSHGALDEQLLWPVLRVQMPKPLLDRYHNLTDPMGDASEVEKFEQVIAWAEETEVGKPS